MAFDDILGIPMDFGEEEEELSVETDGANVIDVWDTGDVWSLDFSDIWKSPVPKEVWSS